MRKLIRYKWLVLAVWLAAAAGLFVTAPDMAQLVRDKGQITVPQGQPSTIAAELLDKMDAGSESGEGAGLSSVLVFHREQGLTPADLDQVKRAAERLKDSKAAYGITGVTTHFDMQELEKQMVSEDGTTVLLLVQAAKEGKTASEVRTALYDALADVPVEHYYTGDWLISEDVIESSQEGLRKTEGITVIFILAILILVFRSPVAPFIPLLSVGLTYVVSQSVVAFLVHYADFPLSNFTQIFLVAVLFGIGTDYCILLISRFKEELAQRGDTVEAIVETYRTAGRTVFVSALAVLVGFASIGLSNFVLYRSAVAVAVGVAVLLLALFTLVPFFMAVLGKSIFWPVKGTLTHKPSRLWGAVGRFSLKRPAWALLLLAILLVPALSAYQGAVSYNSLDEIGDKYDSVKAFQMISDSFGPGDSLPATIVVQADRPLNTTEGLAAIEQLSREVARLEGIKTVRSATRPTGEPLEELRVTHQIGYVEEGIGQSRDGLGEIGNGLSEASQALSSNAPKLAEAAEGAERLAAGTEELQTGLTRLTDGLKQIEEGLSGGSVGAESLTAGLTEAKSHVEQLASASLQLLAGYREIGSGLGELTAAYEGLEAKQRELAAGLSSLGEGVNGLARKFPQLAEDPDYRALVGTVAQLQAGAAGIADGLSQLGGQLAGVGAGIAQANSGLEQAASGQQRLASGLGQLAEGMAGLQQGLTQASGGQKQIIAGIPAMTSGAGELAAGQRELQNGFADLNAQLGQLTEGLDQSVSGLRQVSDGLATAQTYLSGLSATPDTPLAGWYLPQDVIESEQFRQSLDIYMSGDRTIAKLDVVLAGNPYATSSLDKIDELTAAAQRALADTDFSEATVAIDGVSSINHDLRGVSESDYSRTMVMMLIGITLILIILFRSLVMPLYLVLSLLVTFYTALAITELIYVQLLGYAGISWAVPFFGFVMLMALGIDYSIFLMDRFKEYKHLSPKEGILKAMENMGTVIMSAALILGGTFAAMLPSGVLSLLQIATIVLCGLFLYALVMLPLFIPVMVRVFGQGNWWPFMPKRTD